MLGYRASSLVDATLTPPVTRASRPYPAVAATGDELETLDSMLIEIFVPYDLGLGVGRQETPTYMLMQTGFRTYLFHKTQTHNLFVWRVTYLLPGG